MDKNYTTKQIAPDTIEVTVTINKDSINQSYETLLANELKNTHVKGFRKGATPRDVVEEKLKPQILFEVFNRLAPLHLSNVVTKEKIELIASPEYKELPELSLDKDVTFTVHCTIMPEFKLGNMKKVKVEKKDDTVKDTEVDAIIKQLEENKNIKAKKGTKKWVEEAAKMVSVTGVETLEQLKEEIKKVLSKEKTAIIKRESENDALNQAIALSKIEVPDPAVHYEAHEREHSFVHQLESMKMTIDQYAKSMGTAVQNLVDMWHKDAKEALETDVFLKLYAKEKGITVSDKELEEEIVKVKQSNPKESDMYDDPQWREYVRRVTLKQRSFEKFIEEVLPQKKK